MEELRRFIQSQPESQLHRYLCYGLMGYGASTFLSTMVIAAPYGRYHDKTSSKLWGPLLPAKLGRISYHNRSSYINQI